MMQGKMILGQSAEIPGPKKGFVFPNPEVAASLINKAKRPLFVVGSESPNILTKDGELLDSIARLSKKKKFTVVATAHMVSEFNKMGIKGVFSMSLMNLGDRLRDESWEGFDGKGSYDIVVFAGFPYYLEWLVLSGLKNFAPSLKTISLDRCYQPNASWSMGLMTEKDWMEAIDIMIKKQVEVA